MKDYISPERLSLSGSHGRRPWVYGVLNDFRLYRYRGFHKSNMLSGGSRLAHVPGNSLRPLQGLQEEPSEEVRDRNELRDYRRDVVRRDLRRRFQCHREKRAEGR